MSKRSDKGYAFLMLLSIIAAIFYKFWYVIIPLIIILITYYYYKEAIRKKERTKYLKALSISDIDIMEGIEFEYYVMELLESRGYDANVTSASNDFGVDIVASMNNNTYAIQVKRKQTNVSRRAVSDAVAGMSYYDCNNCMVITNSYYSKGAIELAQVHDCVLIDRQELVKWIQDFEGI